MTTKTRTTKADLEKQVEFLTAQVTALLNQSNQNNNNNNININERVKITTYFLGEEALTLNGNDIPLPELGAKASITISESDDLIRKYKDRVASGLIDFDDEKWYDYHGITKPDYTFDDKYLTEVLNATNTIEIFDKITNNRKTTVLFHQLIYRIVQLIRTHKVRLDYDKRIKLEKYFQVKFDYMARLVEERQRVG